MNGHRAAGDDEKREILDRLCALWTRHPALRLGQLIGNVYHSTDTGGVHLYYEEDFPLIDALETAYRHVPEVRDGKQAD